MIFIFHTARKQMEAQPLSQTPSLISFLGNLQSYLREEIYETADGEVAKIPFISSVDKIVTILGWNSINDCAATHLAKEDKDLIQQIEKLPNFSSENLIYPLTKEEAMEIFGNFYPKWDYEDNRLVFILKLSTCVDFQRQERFTERGEQYRNQYQYQYNDDRQFYDENLSIPKLFMLFISKLQGYLREICYYTQDGETAKIQFISSIEKILTILSWETIDGCKATYPAEEDQILISQISRLPDFDWEILVRTMSGGDSMRLFGDFYPTWEYKDSRLIFVLKLSICVANFIRQRQSELLLEQHHMKMRMISSQNNLSFISTSPPLGSPNSQCIGSSPFYFYPPPSTEMTTRRYMQLSDREASVDTSVISNRAAPGSNMVNNNQLSIAPKPDVEEIRKQHNDRLKNLGMISKYT